MAAVSGRSGRANPKPASPVRDPEALTFSQLVKARERQQERAKAELKAQNEDLRRQLDAASPTHRSASAGAETFGMLLQSPDDMPPLSNLLGGGSVAGTDDQHPMSVSAGRDRYDSNTIPDGSRRSSVEASVLTGAGGSPEYSAGSPTASSAPTNSVVPTTSAAVQSHRQQPAAPSSAPGGITQTDLKRVYDEIRTLIQKNQDVTAKALIAYQDKFEKRIVSMQHSIDDLHNAMLKDETTRSVLRDEQLQQHMELCAEIETVRTEMVTANAAQQFAQAQQRTTEVELLAEQVARLERRLEMVESHPKQLRSDLSSLEERFGALAAGINAERASIEQQRAEQVLQQEAKLQEVIAEARAQLTSLQTAMQACDSATRHAMANVNDQLKAAVDRVGEQMETDISTRLDEQTERLQTVSQRQAMDFNTMQNELQTQFVDLKTTIDGALATMRRQYHDAVQDQLKAVVEEADEFEAQRRAAFPVADPDRVALMLKELEGASTTLESVMQQVCFPVHEGTEALEGRVAAVEAALSSLDVLTAVGLPAAPRPGTTSRRGSIIPTDTANCEDGVLPPLRVMVSFPTQTEITGPFNVDEGAGPTAGSGSASESVAVRAQRHLEGELNKAADEVREARTRKVIARAEAAQSTSTASNLVLAVPPVPTSVSGSFSATTLAETSAPTANRTASAATFQRDQDAFAPTSGGAHTSTSAPPILGTRGSNASPSPLPVAGAGQRQEAPLRSLSAAGLRERRMAKETVLAKVQGLLRTIQATFHALSEQEEAQAHEWSAQRVAEVASQKQEMHARERQLLEQRNALYHEMQRIEEEEEARRDLPPVQ